MCKRNLCSIQTNTKFWLIKMCINWFKNNIKKIKIKIKQHFKVGNLLYNLISLSKLNFITSVGIDEIYFGTKNPKRFQLCIVNCMISWIVCLFHLLLLTSDFMFSLIKSPFLPNDFNVLNLLLLLFLIHSSIIKTDFLFGEINYNLSPLKLCYLILKGIESKHKLTAKNYNRLAILLEFSIVGLIYYGLPILSTVILTIESLVAINTKRLLWFLNEITIFFINGYIAISTAGITVICGISYYKMRFDQLHHQIKSIIPNGKIINKKREKSLLNLINQHNKLSIKVNKFNIIFKRTIASCFIHFSLMKIISLYLMFNTENYLNRILAINAFALYFVFGLTITYLLSLQIKSAHQSLDLIHSVVCKYTMRLPFKLKVKLYFKNKLTLILFNFS